MKKFTVKETKKIIYETINKLIKEVAKTPIEQKFSLDEESVPDRVYDVRELLSEFDDWLENVKYGYFDNSDSEYGIWHFGYKNGSYVSSTDYGDYKSLKMNLKKTNLNHIIFYGTDDFLYWVRPDNQSIERLNDLTGWFDGNGLAYDTADRWL